MKTSIIELKSHNMRKHTEEQTNKPVCGPEEHAQTAYTEVRKGKIIHARLGGMNQRFRSVNSFLRAPERPQGKESYW